MKGFGFYVAVQREWGKVFKLESDIIRQILKDTSGGWIEFGLEVYNTRGRETGC